MPLATAPRGEIESQRRHWQVKVRDPLERLRGTIRLYVSLEGAAVLGLYLALWFWIGLVLDYGFFKAFTLDWVQVLPWGVRAGVLSILVAGLVALLVLKVTLRIVREFRDAALALVLERRFPNLLGDRLITAVELADPCLAARYGYSQEMVDQTVADAAERVGQVPIKEAFNWRRLRAYFAAVLVLTAGLFTTTGLGYCAWNQTTSVGSFVTEFGTVSAIWFERNILLENTIWPRRTYLELVNFPGSGELKVSRDEAAAPIRVRALRWVRADRSVAEGWRSLRWSDVTADLLGYPPPELPAEFFPPGQDWTVDRVELMLDRADIKQKMNGAVRGDLDATLQRLGEVAARPAMARTLRKLEIPERVTVFYKGETVRNELTLTQESDYEFSGLVADLKETMRFQACAEDYCTAVRTISVVPPPTVTELVREESHPAYLYHRPPVDQGPDFLQGKKQHLPPERVYLSGKVSSIVVPAGADIRLIGKSDKTLDRVEFVPRGETEAKDAVPVLLHDDGRTFEASFAHVTTRIDFEFKLTDTDGTFGRRRVSIQPAEDVSPEVEVVVEGLRKSVEGFMITPSAMAPFAGRVRDDHGLARLDYGFSSSPVDEPSVSRARAVMSLLIMQLTPAGPGNPMAATPVIGVTAKLVEPDHEAKSGAVPLPTFEREMRRRARNDVGSAELLRRLQSRPTDSPFLKLHLLNPDDEFFDVRLHLPELKAVGAGPQPRYRLKLWVRATDTNVETGPRTTQSQEQFAFIVVGEPELLAAIALEEEKLYGKLEGALTRLKENRVVLEQLAQKLKAANFAADGSIHAARAMEIGEAVNVSASDARAVFVDYSRILKEMKANRVKPDPIDKVAKVVRLLDAAVNVDSPRAEDALRELQRTLEKAGKDPEAAKRVDELSGQAERRVDALIVSLQDALDATNRRITLNEIIRLGNELIKDEEENVKLMKELHARLRRLFD